MQKQVSVKFGVLMWLFAVIVSELKSQSLNATLLRFADPLTDNMVVQQNKPFSVWGTAPKLEEVKIEADWLQGPVLIQSDHDGNFLGVLPVPQIERGDYANHTLRITSGNTTVAIENILIGEVWFFSGQSNMQSSMKDILNGAEEIKKADHPNIRLFNAALNFSDSPIDRVKGRWVNCSPGAVEKFSAVGYYFARELQTSLDVPVGVIFSGIGASAAQAYVPRAVLSKDRLLDSLYLSPYLNSDKSKEKVDGGFSFEKVTRPCLLYNAMIHPFRNLSITGFCWYQGESNRKERDGYTHLMHEMIKAWRAEFSQGALPFYYVQVAPFFWDQENPELADYAFFRESQQQIQQLDHTAMVTTMDVGEARDLHPKNKKPVGQRLAYTALHKVYNQLTIVYRGPEVKHVSFVKSVAIITYDPASIDSGLNTNDHGAPKHFSLAGADRKFYPAEAVIKGTEIEVTSSKVKRPIALRYAFTNYPVTNLQNRKGIPALQFRSDRWAE